MNIYWTTAIIASVLSFLTKFSGYAVPERFVQHARIQRINLLIPIALLSALVAVNTLATKKELTFDHRLGGVIFAAIALKLKAPFLVMMLGAGVVSAILYRFGF